MRKTIALVLKLKWPQVTFETAQFGKYIVYVVKLCYMVDVVGNI